MQNQIQQMPPSEVLLMLRDWDARFDALCFWEIFFVWVIAVKKAVLLDMLN